MEKKLTLKNELEVSLLKIKKEKEKDESFEPNEKYNFKELVCGKTEEKFIFHENVKHEISYQTAQSSTEYHSDLLQLNLDQIQKVKEEFMFKDKVKEELNEQSTEECKYSIEIIEHKIQWLDDSSNISPTSKFGDNIEHRIAGGKEDAPVLGGNNLNTPNIEVYKTFEKYGFKSSDVCRKKFTHASHLKSTNTIHSKEEHECDVCHRKFSRKSNLKHHINAVHETIKPSHHKNHKNLVHMKIKSECGVCQHKFVNKKHLKNHLNSVHLGIKYECNMCHKKFTTKRRIVTHTNSVHMGIKYECNMCHRKFSTKEYLATHIDAIHMGIKYKCDVCKCKFMCKRHLKVHINSFHMRMNYVCDVCKRMFTDKNYLNTHMNADHKETNNKIIVKASLCKQTYVTYVNSPFRF